MGEYADYEIDRQMDAFGDSPFGGRRRERQSTICQRCGKTGLRWEHDGDAWVLIQGRNEVHKCDEKVLHKAAADDFEVLDE